MKSAVVVDHDSDSDTYSTSSYEREEVHASETMIVILAVHVQLV